LPFHAPGCDPYPLFARESGIICVLMVDEEVNGLVAGNGVRREVYIQRDKRVLCDSMPGIQFELIRYAVPRFNKTSSEFCNAVVIREIVSKNIPRYQCVVGCEFD